MPYIPPVQVADYWIGAGGPPSRAVEWLAIALGESSLISDIVSPAGAIGIWQIMPFNASIGGGTVQDLNDPAYNAKVAVIMSGGGVNCAAWDSCYLDIQASGRYTYLAWPEQGSSDWNLLPTAQADLAGQGLKGITNPGNPGVNTSLTASIAQWQRIGDQLIPAVTTATGSSARTTAALFTRR